MRICLDNAIVGTASLILFLSIACLLLFTICANAELNVDEYFEKSRGELIGFYGSEIVSHGALVLGFVVAGVTLMSKADDFWNNQKPSVPKRLFFLVFIFLLVLMLCSAFYSGLRVIFWSAMGAYVIDATPDKIWNFLNKNITSSNVTSWTPVLQEYAIKEFENETAPHYWLARVLSPILGGSAFPYSSSLRLYCHYWHLEREVSEARRR
ncbi:MAG: hypothetical protein OEY22_11550 [Candidatus Bathyarchaeota archaeon]|nr:hypothetical protein [Candidatus Bathyarchaeota archaeon]MDH5788023.1 hypothetical protein [Candidatus Bathyarchaeota archaeon]